MIIRPRTGLVALRLAALASSAIMLTTAAPALAKGEMAARKDNGNYVFDVPVPESFLEQIGDRTKPGYNRDEATVKANNQPYTVISTQIGWANDENLKAGTFAMADNEGVRDGFWRNAGSSDPAWPAFVAQLLATAKRNSGGWGFVTVRYLRPAAGAHVTLTYLPSPVPTVTYKGETSSGLQERQEMSRLSDDLVPGSFFAGAKVPRELGKVREAMLRYGNLERAAEKFRQDSDARYAKSLYSGNIGTTIKTVAVAGKEEPVFVQPDLTLSAANSEVAQWFAEYLAAGNLPLSHDGPAQWRKSATETVAMTSPGDRAVAFKIDPANLAEVAGQAGVGDCPYCWMAGDTHFRWWYGVDGTYADLGLGAAQGSNGKWYFIGLARRNPTGGK